METLKPIDIGLKEDYCSKIDIKSLYSNNVFIMVDEFNQKFNTNINSLNHRTLKNIVEDNLWTKEGTRVDTDEVKREPHWISTVPQLYHKQTKGSKIF